MTVGIVPCIVFCVLPYSIVHTCGKRVFSFTFVWARETCLRAVPDLRVITCTGRPSFIRSIYNGYEPI